MKTQITKLVLGLCFLAAAGPLMAQVQHRAVARIPFGFQVNNQNLPAGKYSVTGLETPGAVRLTNEASLKSILVFAPIPATATGSAAKLVFHRYGDEYFLQGIWLADGVGHLVSPGRRERELQASAGSAQGAIVALR